MGNEQRPVEAVDVMKLYEIATELDAVICSIEEADGELTPEAEAALSEWGEVFDKKCERVIHVIRNYEATGKAARDEAKRLTTLAKSRERVSDSLREYLFNQMKRADRERVETALITITRHTNPLPTIDWVGQPGSDEEAPLAYMRIEKKLDKLLCRDAWQAGAITGEGDGFRIQFTEYIKIR